MRASASALCFSAAARASALRRSRSDCEGIWVPPNACDQRLRASGAQLAIFASCVTPSGVRCIALLGCVELPDSEKIFRAHRTHFAHTERYHCLRATGGSHKLDF